MVDPMYDAADFRLSLLRLLCLQGILLGRYHQWFCNDQRYYGICFWKALRQDQTHQAIPKQNSGRIRRWRYLHGNLCDLGIRMDFIV